VENRYAAKYPQLRRESGGIAPEIILAGQLPVLTNGPQMLSQKPSRAAAKSASFHDASARSVYTSRFRDIGISAVAASDAQRRSRPAQTPSIRELPAILRNGFDD
jgi:hypothetical protein